MNIDLYGMIKAFMQVLFPIGCIGCSKVLLEQEQHLCLNCQIELPLANFHHQVSNPLAKTFWGRVSIEQAFAFLIYKKAGLTKSIIQAIKYKGNKQLAIDLGKSYGNQIKEELKQLGVNGIIAVPLHPKRAKKRGFNQSELIVQGIAAVTQIQNISSCVKRKVHTSTQTAKSRIERWENVLDIYEIDMPLLEISQHHHFLLVDDVITTGATIESLAKTLQQHTNCKISIAALAFAP